jgi:coilin
VTNSGKHIDDGKGDNVHQCQDQSGSKKLMSSALDIETKKTLQPETAPLVEQQKTERYYLNSYAAMPDIIFVSLLFEK